MGKAINKTHLGPLKGWAVLVLAAVFILAGTRGSRADICGCQGHPNSLGHFDSADPTTWPAGTTSAGSNWQYYDICASSCYSQAVVIPLPEDGVLIFDSFTTRVPSGFSRQRIHFARNDRNTPVTLLVAGDVTIGERTLLLAYGSDGGSGANAAAGRGGNPGNGGFRGGDGAYLDVDGARNGGQGLGPGGGAGGVADPLTAPQQGVFPGTPELRPLIGGCGGGGGYSSASGVCAAGGGGGGGGSILIAANGTITIESRGGIIVDGGAGGSRYNNDDCSSNGSAGSGGAIRLLAQSFVGASNSYLYARGSRNYSGGQQGVVRIEAPQISPSTMNISYYNPMPVRSSVIGPVFNPVASQVKITAIGGQPVPDTGPLQAITGGVDLTMPAPGTIDIQLGTSGVPSGTTVIVTVKPQKGGTTVSQTTTLNSLDCNTAGECIAFVSFDLDAGLYFVEAEATFQTP